MRPIQRRSWFGPILLSIGLLTLGTVGTIGTLWAMGKIELPFLSRGAPQPPPGTVPIYLSLKTLPAYTRVTRDHLFQPNGNPKLFWLTPEEIAQRGLHCDFNKILGRVTAREIHEGYGFRDKDFLPDGTREGVAGGTPPGKRSLTVDATKIAGANTLKAGDIFDLVACYVNDVPHDAKKQAGSVRIPHLPGQRKYPFSQVIVQKGMVVQPLTTHSAPKPNAAVQPNGKSPMVVVQEIVIAVEPEEVPMVSQALNGASELRAIHRTGLPSETTDLTFTPGTTLPPPDIEIEVLRGGQREVVTFPRPNPAPSPPPPADGSIRFIQGTEEKNSPRP